MQRPVFPHLSHLQCLCCCSYPSALRSLCSLHNLLFSRSQILQLPAGVPPGYMVITVPAGWLNRNSTLPLLATILDKNGRTATNQTSINIDNLQMGMWRACCNFSAQAPQRYHRSHHTALHYVRGTLQFLYSPRRAYAILSELTSHDWGQSWRTAPSIS